jgi:hypothetical protein
MRSLIFAIFTLALFSIGLIALLNLSAPAETAGLIIEKPFIPWSEIQDMAYGRLMDSVSQNRTALIFFYDNSCDQCISQIAEIESLLEHFRNTDPKFLEDSFTYYEYDFNTGLRDRFNVTQDHTLILIKNGKEVLRTREALTKDQLLEKILGQDISR